MYKEAAQGFKQRLCVTGVTFTSSIWYAAWLANVSHHCCYQDATVSQKYSSNKLLNTYRVNAVFRSSLTKVPTKLLHRLRAAFGTNSLQKAHPPQTQQAWCEALART